MNLAELVPSPVRGRVGVVAGRKQDVRPCRRIPLRERTLSNATDMIVHGIAGTERSSVFVDDDLADIRVGRHRKSGVSFIAPVDVEHIGRDAAKLADPCAVNDVRLHKRTNVCHSINPAAHFDFFVLAARCDVVVVKDDSAVVPQMTGDKRELRRYSAVCIKEEKSDWAGMGKGGTQHCVVVAPTLKEPRVSGDPKALNVAFPIANDVVSGQERLVWVRPASLDNGMSPAAHMPTRQSDGRAADIRSDFKNAAVTETCLCLESLKHVIAQHRNFAD